MSRLAGVGIRAWQLGEADVATAVSAAVEIERLGFSALWMPGPEFFERAAVFAEATSSVRVASSVFNIWDVPAVEAAARWRELPHRDRLLMGVGVSHPTFVGEQVYASPLDVMRRWLDVLDAADVPTDARIVGAIHPRMVTLAGTRSLGSHPYLVTADYTAWARTQLGPTPALAPALVVVVEEDSRRARDLARRHLNSAYLKLSNYTRSFLMQGFTPDDLADGGSDRLVDALVVWGSPDRIAERVHEHFANGADHVSLHVIGEDRAAVPITEWALLAESLELSQT